MDSIAQSTPNQSHVPWPSSLEWKAHIFLTVVRGLYLCHLTKKSVSVSVVYFDWPSMFGRTNRKSKVKSKRYHGTPGYLVPKRRKQSFPFDPLVDPAKGHDFSIAYIGLFVYIKTTSNKIFMINHL